MLALSFKVSLIERSISLSFRAMFAKAFKYTQPEVIVNPYNAPVKIATEARYEIGFHFKATATAAMPKF